MKSNEEIKKKPMLYVSNIRLPTEKAHGMQIIETCKELNKLCKNSDRDFELIICDRWNPTPGDIFNYYNINEKEQFVIKQIETISLFIPYKLSYWLQKLHFIIKSQWYVFWKYGYNTILYTRDEFIAFAFLGKVSNIFWETHEGKYNIFYKLPFKFLSGIVTISVGLKDFYKNKFKKEILVAHDAVDISKFDIKMSKDAAREMLKLDKNSTYITYLGAVGLYGWKGVDVFCEASHLLLDYKFIVVGGSDTDINDLKNKYQNKNIIFPGYQKSQISAVYQKASDILVIPNKKGTLLSEKYTSPLKVFQYMASKTPIIASDLPSLREVLNEENSYFFEANNPESLADSIKVVLGGYDLAKSKADKAYLDVQNYTYEKRAEKIYNFVLNSKE
jgi:glycosyltransferase involved in cell wall biosynthesis